MTNLISIISLAIQPISIFISHYLGKKSAVKSLKQNSYKERYDNFYAPYIQKLYAGFLWDKNQLDDISFSTRTIFFDLISNNFKYLDKNTVKLYPELYSLFLSMLEFENSKSKNKRYNPSTEFTIIFIKISISILKEAIVIANELFLPKIGEEILTSYYELLKKYKLQLNLKD